MSDDVSDPTVSDPTGADPTGSDPAGADSTATTDLRTAIEAADLSGSGWHRIEVVESTGSTNADLAARATDDDIVGTVRITTDQTAGRGRRTRVWSAPAGAQIAISAVVAVGDNADRLGWLSLATGIAAATGIEKATGLRPVLKWPNDVLIGERKTAGILAEYVNGHAVVGIGINTNMSESDLPVPTATSLQVATGAPVDAAAVAIEYLRALAAVGWPDGIDDLARQYRQRCDTIGRAVRLELPDGEVTGTARDVDREGRIVIEAADGRTVTAAAGDVVHLRAQ